MLATFANKLSNSWCIFTAQPTLSTSCAFQQVRRCYIYFGKLHFTISTYFLTITVQCAQGPQKAKFSRLPHALLGKESELLLLQTDGRKNGLTASASNKVMRVGCVTFCDPFIQKILKNYQSNCKAMQGLLKLLWTVYSEGKLQSCLKFRNFHNPFNKDKSVGL